MDHPDWPAFLAAIIAEPNDNTLRLVAADFLEENGAVDRAAFIRVQIALAGNWSHETDVLRKREQAYLDPRSAYAPVWAAEECPELVRILPPNPYDARLTGPSVVGAERLLWRRGFVERVYCFAPDWLRHGVAIRARNPIRQVALRLDHGLSRDDWAAGLPALRGLASVDFYRSTGALGSALFNWLGELLPGTQVSVLS